MNSRQKIVQQQFIDNEKAVLNRLKQVYGKALDDINTNISDLMSRTDSDTASVVYRVEYQKALKNQISGILDELNSNQFNTVSEYLATCYDDGYIGTMYDLHGQGIPIITPINQENVVRAVQLDSKISNGLYSRMGEDVSMLKKHITAQVSRGIANGSSFAQVAQQISFKMTGTYNTNGGALGNAMRIARTEGHRIQVQGAMDACYNAKEKGADIVKQWDSTLDARTRDSHARVDGEIRELDEKFSNGLMYPADPSGGAAEVVNCRCALLQRAKWALDEKELDVLKNRAAAFGLDKTDNFNEFKAKYLKATQKPVKTESKTAKFTPAKTESKKQADIYSFDDEQSEAIEWYVSGEGQYINQYYRGRVGADFGDLTDNEKILAKKLDEATARVLPDDIDTLYRSVDASAIFGDISENDWYNFQEYMLYGEKYHQQKAESILNRAKGKTITEKGFMSTTKDYDLANDWGDFTGATKPVVIEFDNIPKGVNGADLKRFDIEGDEQQEVLLARNTQYEIVDIFAKDGNIHIKAKIKKKTN